MAGVSLFRVGDDVEFWRVLRHLSILVLFVIAFEQGLHKLEHRLKRSPKFEEMLSKVYRELMILGFLGLGLKVAKEIFHLDGYSPAMTAFQVADLTIFILALALILQAICVFLLLRKHNRDVGRAELVSTSDIVDVVLVHQQKEKKKKRSWFVCHWFKGNVGCKRGEVLSESWSCCKEIVELRVLRHLFLRRYGLPELFPFSKYLRQAQDNQITHMIDVEISTWFLLLAVAWCLEVAMAALREVHTEMEKHAMVTVFFVFAWALVLLHFAVHYYFSFCLRQLLRSAGYTTVDADRIDCLKRIAQEETDAWNHEVAGDALRIMQKVQEKQEAKHLKRKRHRHHVIESDIGLQLLATCFRHVNRRFFSRSTRAKRDESTTSDASLDSPSPGSGRQQHLHRQLSLAPVEIRWFSRKAWHFTVMFLLMLNGFYFALLLQCILYQLTAIYDEFGVVLMLLIPLPLFLNTLVFQPRIFRNFMIVCSIFRVHVSTLTEVINHFSEIVELRSEFVRSLGETMNEASLTIGDLQRELEAKDPNRSGRIEVEKLRQVLRGFGFRLSHSRFNIVAKMLFKLRGTKLEYAQVVRLVSLMKQEGFSSENPAASSHPLLRQSLLFDDDPRVVRDELEEDPPAPSDGCFSAQGSLSAEPSASPRGRLLKRHGSQLLGTSSRAVRCLYHIDSVREDGSEDPSAASHYVSMREVDAEGLSRSGRRTGRDPLQGYV